GFTPPRLCPSGCGGIFQLTPPAQGQTQWTETVIYNFKGDAVSPFDGGQPFGGLIADANGAFYGTTVGGGTGDGAGTLFQLTPPTQGQTQWTETVLYNFQGLADGEAPSAQLLLGQQGVLYGTTQQGGQYGGGTVFQLTPPAQGQTQWTKTVLYSF